MCVFVGVCVYMCVSLCAVWVSLCGVWVCLFDKPTFSRHNQFVSSVRAMREDILQKKEKKRKLSGEKEKVETTSIRMNLWKIEREKTISDTLFDDLRFILAAQRFNIFYHKISSETRGGL